MRSLSVIIAMLVSTTISAQAYNCGMFGTITDDVNNLYIARFDLLLENVILESVISCEVIEAPITVWDIRNGKRNTVIWMDIEHDLFNALPYKIKYPTGGWQIMRQKNNIPSSDTWWPVDPTWYEDE